MKRLFPQVLLFTFIFHFTGCSQEKVIKLPQPQTSGDRGVRRAGRAGSGDRWQREQKPAHGEDGQRDPPRHRGWLVDLRGAEQAPGAVRRALSQSGKGR